MHCNFILLVLAARKCYLLCKSQHRAESPRDIYTTVDTTYKTIRIRVAGSQEFYFRDGQRVLGGTQIVEINDGPVPLLIRFLTGTKVGCWPITAERLSRLPRYSSLNVGQARQHCLAAEHRSVIARYVTMLRKSKCGLAIAACVSRQHGCSGPIFALRCDA